MAMRIQGASPVLGIAPSLPYLYTAPHSSTAIFITVISGSYSWVGLPNWRYGWVNRISTGSRVLLVTRHAPGGYLHSIESRLGQRRDPIRTPSTYTCHASRTFTRARHHSRREV